MIFCVQKYKMALDPNKHTQLIHLYPILFGWHSVCCDIVLWELTVKYYKLGHSQFPAVLYMEYHPLWYCIWNSTFCGIPQNSMEQKSPRILKIYLQKFGRTAL